MLSLIYFTVVAILLVAGLAFMLIAAWGLLKMPDVYNRMHASTKGVTLGVSCLALAAALILIGLEDAPAGQTVTTALLIIVFQLIANPVGAHLLAKAAHRAGYPLCKQTVGDELAEDRIRGKV